MIMVISTGRRAMLGRQAWRALGWNVREVKLEILPPFTTWFDVARRFAFHRAQMMDMREAATQFTEGLRDIYRILTSVDANAVAAARATVRNK
jgi:hypothetical protein